MGHTENGEEGGEIVFGGTNTERYDASTLKWAPVIRRGYWEVKLEGAKFGGKTLDIGEKVSAAIDTGRFILSINTPLLTHSFGCRLVLVRSAQGHG